MLLALAVVLSMVARAEEAAAAEEEAATAEVVLTLHADNFDNAIAKHPFILVEFYFYAPWKWFSYLVGAVVVPTMQLQNTWTPMRQQPPWNARTHSLDVGRDGALCSASAFGVHYADPGLEEEEDGTALEDPEAKEEEDAPHLKISRRRRKKMHPSMAMHLYCNPGYSLIL